MNHTILCKEGYLIPKNDKNKLLIEKAIKELMVEPYQEYSFTKKEENIKFPVYKENDEYISVPKYYGLKTFGKPDINNENSGKEITIIFKGNLRPAQTEIVDKVVPYINKNDGGVLVLPCAAGKTVIALYLASLFKVKTLVIVHKTFLLNQWKERAEEFTNAKIGIIQQNKIDIDNKDIVIGMLQSIAKDKYDTDVFKDFGLVIFDEAHHSSSKYFSKALPLIASKLSIGLSATPKRADKMEKILYWFFGDIMYKSPTEENNKVLVNIINYDIEHEKFKEYKMYTGDINKPKTINKITTIGRRNKFIIDQIEEILQEPNRQILVLSDRINHLKSLKQRIDKREIATTDFYVGGMKQKALDIAQNAQIIFASYGMASEGLDIPNLNTLFMVTPRSNIEQSVGRIVRKKTNITPTIYDYVDKLPSFTRQGYKRRQFYKKMDYQIKITDVKNNEIIKISDIDTNNCIQPKKNDGTSSPSYAHIDEFSTHNNNCDFID
jgi:superfamily II DNA or RNA helicase